MESQLSGRISDVARPGLESSVRIKERQFVYSCGSPLTNHFSSAGALYNKDTESLKSILEDVFKNELPRILQTYEYRLVLTPLNVDGKDLLSKGMYKMNTPRLFFFYFILLFFFYFFIFFVCFV